MTSTATAWSGRPADSLPGAAVQPMVTVVGAGGQAAQPGADSVSLLERLAKLHESGAITDEEFEQQKAKILGT